MKDYSRIGELFYEEKGGNKRVSLDAFLHYGLVEYARRYADDLQTRQATIAEKGGTLSFMIEMAYNRPDVTSIRLKGIAQTDIISLLRGEIEAYYDTLSSYSLPPDLQSLITERRRNNFVHLPGMTLVFSEHPDTPDLVKQLIIYGTSKGDLTRSFRQEHQSQTEALLLALLSIADQISSDHGFYNGTDIRHEFLKERVTLVRSDDGTHLDYTLESPHHSGLPANQLTRAGSFFDSVRHQFTLAAHHHLTFTLPQEAFYHDP
ncbi:MAG: hypothetical protein ABIJ21_06575 [Nanoarchaeota archaeon]